MWLITPFGFFSIVQKSQDKSKDTLTVRARVSTDLDELRATLLPELGQTSNSAGTDYRYRASAPRDAIARAMARMAQTLEYSNFKDEVCTRQGAARSDLYHDVWSVLMKLQKEEVKYTKKLKAGVNRDLAIAKADTYGGVLVDEANSRILLREPLNHFGGYVWTFPKGGPDKNETPEQTALREVEEETGYTAKIAGVLPGIFKGSTSKTAAFFVMRPVGKPLGPTPETAQIKWVALSEAHKLIELTPDKRGRARDLAIVQALEAWLREPDNLRGKLVER